MYKSKRKIIIITILVVTIFSILITKSQGANEHTFSVNLKANTTILKPGEEMTITIGVSDINMGANGINTLEGKIKYDENIFETIKSSSIQSLNNWTTTYNDESSTLNGKFLAVNLSSGIKENTSIFKVTLKVKQEVKNTTNTQVDFENITSNDGADLINVGNKSVNVTIKVENTNETSPEELNKNEVDTNNGNKSEINKNQAKVDRTQSSTKLPKAGKSIVVISVLVLAVIVFIVLGIKNRSMRDIK